MRESNDALDSSSGPTTSWSRNWAPCRPWSPARPAHEPVARGSLRPGLARGGAMGSWTPSTRSRRAPLGHVHPRRRGQARRLVRGLGLRRAGACAATARRGAESPSELQDKADRCRARNREHARQTRRRKKEFVENLQVSVQTLTRENEMMAARPATWTSATTKRAQRVDTVARILTLRVSETDQGADDPAFWGELVEPDFELRLPHTPYAARQPQGRVPARAVGEVDRVVCLEFMFDTVGLWQQLTRAARSPTAEPYVAIPNTLDDAVRDSEDARVVTTAKRPFVIEHVNDAWTKLCGFTAEEAVGKTLAILQGPDTEKGEVADLVRGCEDGHATSALLTNYTKEGDKFQNFLRVFPLTEDDGTKVSHMLGVLQNVNA
ncbi:PAS domain-containing protein [Aureococcus anophagefferens]|nr:PAS domain-containing protein [Aureococcus anophagefferens]